MKYDAVSFSWAGDKYIGTPYSKMDCQAFVEKCMADVGYCKDLGGSNSWYRECIKNGWTGTPEDCKRTFGQIPKGAILFIWEPVSASTPEKFRKDGIGDITHMGIKTGRGDGAIHSSATRRCVATSQFKDKTIPNGGWNRIGLLKVFDYGKSINEILDHGGGSPPDEKKEEVVLLQGKVKAADGTTVKLRQKPSADCRLYWDIPIGTEVLVTDYGPEWSKIIAGGLTGWMMTKFIELDGEVVPGDEEVVDPGETDIEDDPEIDPDSGTEAMVTLQVPLETCAAAYQFFRQIADQIEKKIGRG
jgi:hypothetical protein